MEHQDGCATSSINTSSFHPSDDFMDILTPLILNLAIDSL